MLGLAERLSRVLTTRSAEGLFSGTVLLRRTGETLFQDAYGYANRSWSVLNEVDTRFRIASVSKMFTAVGVLQLVDRGELFLDTRVTEFLSLKDTTIPRDATVYHMLTMTSGMADWFDESGDWEKEWAALCREHPIYLLRENKDYLPLFIHKPPERPVGEGYQYNGAGYILLGLMIEKVSGLSYAEFVRRNVFAGAGMVQSDFLALDDVVPEVAEGYLPVISADEEVIGWRKNIYSTTPEAAADGGATSTADDLARFAQALREGRLLSPGLTEAMLSPHVLQQEAPYRGFTWKYGYGNEFILDKEGRMIRWGHTGEEDGVSCRLYHYPQRDIDVVILGNQSWCAGNLGWAIHDLMHEGDL